jgi:hypothetical protein
VPLIQDRSVRHSRTPRLVKNVATTWGTQSPIDASFNPE